MSPVLARAAMRSVQRRQFSLISAMRTTMRQFEPHPFQRLPVAQTPQAADWAKIIKRTGKNAVLYFPGMAFVLGWPLLAEAALNGHM